MGFRVLLIAVTGKSIDAIHHDYDVTPTGMHEEIPESPVTAVMLPSGQYLLYINDEITPDDRVFSRLSKNASLIACYSNETDMNSFACGWTNGVAKWSVAHDAQQNITHLETTGDLPGEFGPIRERLSAEQDDVDDVDYIFDIPVELFVSLGGIRYDDGIEADDPEPWHILTRQPTE